MNTETIERPAPVTALTLPQRAAVALGTATHEIKLRELLTNSAGILTVTNKAGRDECHTAYMVLKNARISITNLSDEATEDAKLFTKAVKAEALRLLNIILSEEERLQTLRDGFDVEEKARKEALIAAEMARTALIAEHIEDIRNIPLRAAGKDSVAIRMALDEVSEITGRESVFGEQAFQDKAVIVRDAAYAKLTEMLAARIAIEQAETQRIAAIAAADLLRAEQAAENARVAADNKRIAAEQAAMAEMLADQQAALVLAAKLQADQAVAAIQAAAEVERKAAAERERVNAAVKAQLEQKAADLAAERKLFEDQQAMQVAQVERDAVHGEALEMDEAFHMAMAPADAPTPSTVLPESIFDGAPRTSSPTADEIIQVLAEHYDESPEVVADWMSSMVFGMSA